MLVKRIAGLQHVPIFNRLPEPQIVIYGSAVYELQRDIGRKLQLFLPVAFNAPIGSDPLAFLCVSCRMTRLQCGAKYPRKVKPPEQGARTSQMTYDRQTDLPCHQLNVTQSRLAKNGNAKSGLKLQTTLPKLTNPATGCRLLIFIDYYFLIRRNKVDILICYKIFNNHVLY